jgi:prepilin-type N-terminal cleavage/methylation domain-containing protein
VTRVGQRGFSLVETLVATAVLGVGLLGMTKGITAVLDGTHTAESYSRAVLLAEEQMELICAEGVVSAGEHEGDFGDEFPGFRWKSVVRESRESGLFEVEVTVLGMPAEYPVYELTTLIFVPPAREIEEPRAAGEAPGEAARSGETP